MKSEKKGLGRVAIYYRVSTDKQELDSQKSAIEKWLEDLPDDQKPRSVTVFEDEGISGSTLRRPGFQEMMKTANEQRLDTIVCYRLDRFSRNATTAINLLLNLDEQGVAFISVTQPVLNLGHENPFRRTMLAAFAEIAEIERETIVTRVRSGLDAVRRRGVKLGAPVRINEEMRQQALTLRKSGKTFKQVALELQMSVGSVHRLVKDDQDKDLPEILEG